mmetsp:Transcript_32603/g.80690  ORF Transcript_32603/g.80690 Transcript_32603/m.80690 type:complete len:584 (-) Transcript_32603:945-2696(-)
MKISSQMKLLALCLAYAVSVRRAAAMAARNTREIFQHTMAPVSLAEEDAPVSVDVPVGERNITIRWAGPTDTADDADLQENVTADNNIGSGCRQHFPSPLRYKINPGKLSLSHRERLQHLLQHNHFSHPDASPIVLLAADPADDESDAEDSFDTGNATEWKDTDIEETGEADEQGDEGADTSMALQVDSPVRQHLRSHRSHHPVVFLETGSWGPVTVPTNKEIDLPKDTPTIGQRKWTRPTFSPSGSSATSAPTEAPSATMEQEPESKWLNDMRGMMESTTTSAPAAAGKSAPAPTSSGGVDGWLDQWKNWRSTSTAAPSSRGSAKTTPAPSTDGEEEDGEEDDTDTETDTDKKKPSRLGRWLGRITGKEGDEGAKLIGIGDNSTTELSQFAQDILNGHNKLRKGAGLKPVKWSGALAKFMRGHLKTLHQQNSCRMMHSTNQQRTKVGKFQRVGENLYMSWGSQSAKPKGAGVANSWYDEVHCYRYGPIGNSCTTYPNSKCTAETGFPQDPRYVMTGHFTQLMWESVTHIGCAMHGCGKVSGRWSFLAGCVYGSTTKPYGGNMYGQYPFSDKVAAKLKIPACA